LTQQLEEQAGQVMARRIQPEQLNIEHVRKPGERVPVGGMPGLKRPGQPFPAQTALHLRIGGYVILIVVMEEVVQANRPEGGQRYRGKQQTYENSLPVPLRAQFHRRLQHWTGG
jgi:hypothetical protein